MDQDDPDVGFYVVTDLPTSVGRFKTPTVREIAKTAPYMHDGSMSTLAEVVDFYDKGGHPNPNLDRGMRPLRLTEQEKSDLVQFMVEGLSADSSMRE
jgi:cytochrome c peroxidase